MTIVEWIAIISIVAPMIIGIGWLIFKLGRFIEEMTSLVKKISSMDIKLEELWRLKTTVSNSPSVLNRHGKKVLKDSNIQEFTDKHFNDIVYKVKKLNPKNAYEVQEHLINVVRELKHKAAEDLEESISNLCSDIDTILFVAAINMRDIVIDYLNFKREDIEKNDPQKGFDPKNN